MNIKKMKNINTKYIGKNIIYLKEVDSTQEEAKRLIKQHKAINGTIIITDIQKDGKGQYGRKWYMGNNGNIAISIILFPNSNINKFDNLTILIAECIIQSLKELYNTQLKIKKPNDVMINNKKIGGILTQSVVKNEFVKSIIIGIGINVNQEKFNEEIATIATSLKNEFSNINFNCEDIICKFCEIFEVKFNKILE